MDLSILSQEQKYAFSLFEQGKNVFVSGPGGTGKTKLIEYFVQHSIVEKKITQVCALTGCATILLPKMCRARTIHSWSGIRLCKGINSKIVENALKYKKNKDNWRTVEILIVDEVSMMSKKVLDVLNSIAQKIRHNTKPFGGIQVVFLGDFYQLPPVCNGEDIDADKFCFESDVWRTLFPLENVVLLKTIFRQDDPKYKEILLQIRTGKLSTENSKILQTHVNKPFDKKKYNGVVPTKLFPTRAKTDYLNNFMFQQLKTEKKEFTYIEKTNCRTYLENNKPLSIKELSKCSRLTQPMIEHEIAQLINNIASPKVLQMKIGAVVMCTVNLDMDNDICNGTQGVITNILESEYGPIPEVTFMNGIKKQLNIHYTQSEEYPSIAIGQIPLCLAWALTIHKIQGATLHMAEIDVGSQVFECGQTYVALSRVKSLDGLYLSAFNSSKIKINPQVKELYDTIPEKSYEIINTNYKSVTGELCEETYEENNIKKIIL